jgi:hypothetical protein
LIKTAASVIINNDLCCPHITTWGDSLGQQEDYSLLLRMLPLESDRRNMSRSDNHMWPKGTFIQLSNRLPIRIDQRQQRKHNRNEWQFASKELSLAPHIPDPKIPTKLHIFCYDDQRYISCVSLSRYRHVDEVLQHLLDKSNPNKLFEVTFSEGLRHAKSFAASMISIDIDGDSDDETDPIGKFIISLICPLSRGKMELPVRGKDCLHQQVSHNRQQEETVELRLLTISAFKYGSVLTFETS